MNEGVPLAITPADIQAQTFSEAKRGYDPAEVDVFLEQLASEVDAMLAKIVDLKNRLTATEQQLADAQAQLAAGPAANEWANGYDCYCWLKRQAAGTDFTALSETLTALAGRIIGRRGLTVSVMASAARRWTRPCRAGRLPSGGRRRVRRRHGRARPAPGGHRDTL